LRPTNYSAADRDVIDALYLRMYEDELDGRPRVTLRTNRLITAAAVTGGTGSATGPAVALDLTEHITGERERLTVDRVVLATGYTDLGVRGRTELLPPLLRDLAGVLGVDADSPLSVGLDYGVDVASTGRAVPPIYVNGLCESTHGLGDAGSFSLLALRSKAIVASLRQRLAASGGADTDDGGDPERVAARSDRAAAGSADLVGAGPLRGSAS
jgi:L-ornithine N5-oxygenase